MKLSSIKPILICILVMTLLIALAAIIVPSTAYFSAVFDMTGTNSVMVELIFDRLSVTNGTELPFRDIANTTENATVYYTYDSTAEWGSAQNPYVISQKMHIQNLSVLQNSGFFNKRTETVDGVEKIKQSYFLVCNSDGTTAAIDCAGLSIDPVGNSENPFTGVICGSFAGAGATPPTYKNYGVSVSTIANLTINAKKDTPDIGFFGHLGYYGTYDPNTATIDAGGYAAQVADLLFADVTVKSDHSVLTTLQEWWTGFAEHFNLSDKRAETHHIGIVAGHAEFATVENVSVYYSDSVPAFQLDSDESGSVTNYYSSTGLIGLLQYVNPEIGPDGALDGSGGVSDSDISSDGGGGGGEASGTLTGYMLAERLFVEHEKYLTAQGLGKNDVYDVREMMTEGENGYQSIFSTCVMHEGFSIFGYGGTYRKYYYFADSVFTFAMSMSVTTSDENGTTDTPTADDLKKVDYVCKIWDITDTGENRPSISATDSKDKWEYTDDIDAQPRISYKLTALESATFTAGGYYVAARFDSANNKLYVFDINANDTTLCKVIDLTDQSSVNEVNGQKQITYFDDGVSIKTIDIIGTGKEYYEYSFKYTSAALPITHPDDTIDTKFGLHTPAGKYEVADMEIGLFGQDESAGSSGIFGIGAQDAYAYQWQFGYYQNGKFSIQLTKRLGAVLIDTRKYARATFKFENGSIGFITESQEDNFGTYTFDDSNYFTIFKLNANTVTSSNNKTTITKLGDGNIELTPKNIIPTTTTDTDGNVIYDTAFEFDPSKYVFEYQADGTYKLAPIRSYRLNNGGGDLLGELNHIVKLFKATDGNYSLDLGGLVSSNNGGVLDAPIGTSTDKYTIPAGMIAFDIREASAENPSYINLIVAINPEQASASEVGIWKITEGSFSKEFDLTNPIESFKLPISKTAAGTTDMGHMLTISEYVTETETEDGKREYQSDTTPYYTYLGGDTALVYYSFSIEETGVYFIGSKTGSLSVSYFSVSGAAGAGNDGASGSPLGDFDFVYANDTTKEIITVDKKYTEEVQIISEEDYTQYYPSMFFLTMQSEGEQLIQNENVVVRRYIDETDTSGTKRHIKADIEGQNLAALTPVSELYEDVQDDLDSP